MFQRLDRDFLNFALSLYVPGFFLNLGWALVSPILPLYAESFGVSYTLVGMVITANALGRIFGDIPLGSVCDRVGRRPIAVLGPLLVTLSAILCGLAGDFYELLVYRFLTGLGMAMWMIARQAIVADSVDSSIRGRVLSTFQSVNMIGSATGPAVGGVVAAAWGYRAPFFFYAASTLICAVTCFLLVKESVTKKEDMQKTVAWTDMRRVLGFLTLPTLMAALANFMNHIRFGARAILIPLYGGDILGMNPGEIGLILSASTFANVVMAVPGGYVVDRYGRKTALIPAFVACALIFYFFPFFNDFGGLVLMAALLGVASGFGGGATLALAVDLSPDRSRALFIGFWNTVGDIGSAVCPLLLGFIADSYGLVSSFTVTAALMLLTAGTTKMFVKETLAAGSKESPERSDSSARRTALREGSPESPLS